MNSIGRVLMGVTSSGILGCVSNAPMNGDVDPELVCRDRHVTVNHAPAFLVAYPEYIDVCAGQRITISVVPEVDARSARTTPARSNVEEAPWLRSETRDGNSMIIVIPENAAYDTYKYSITIDGIGTLDPRVRVSRR